MSPVRLREFLENQCRINPTTGTLEERHTGQRIAAVLPVHLYGQMAEMDAIIEQAERFGLCVIEDACQAHGAMYFSARDGCWHKPGRSEEHTSELQSRLHLVCRLLLEKK